MHEGLVFASDTRTNAGVDYVTTYSKMFCFAPAEDRVFTILTAGNLATTQEILYRLQRDLDTQAAGNLCTVNYLFEAAHYLGKLSQLVQAEHSSALSRSGVDGRATLIIGGQLHGQPHGIFLVYPQGNYIPASPETPYLQIGESKYGKPMLDRIMSESLTLDEGAKLALVSLDATIRSNVTVGMPFEIAMYATGSLALPKRQEIRAESTYYELVKLRWQKGLSETFKQLPNMAWPDHPVA
jgi:putative proteasome-type protease